MAMPLERPSGRVIAVDPEGCVLLFRIDDPVDTKPPIWITPGVGIESGESPAEAAVREFEEETGIAIDLAMVGAPSLSPAASGHFEGSVCTRSIGSSPGALRALNRPRSAGQCSSRSFTRLGVGGIRTTMSAQVMPCSRDLAAVARRIASGSATDAPIELPWFVFE
jgi:hypothetical protein